MELLQRSFEDCGPWMYPVLALSIVVLAVVVERTVTFVGRWGVRGDAFLAAVEKLVRHGNLDRALRLTGALGPSVPIGRIVREGLRHADEGSEGVRHAMDEAIRQARPLLRRRLFPLLKLGAATLVLGVVGSHQLGGFHPPAGVATPLPFGQPMAMAPLMAGAAIDAVATFAFAVFSSAGTIERHLNEARERLPGLYAGRERGAGGEVRRPPAGSRRVPRLTRTVRRLPARPNRERLAVAPHRPLAAAVVRSYADGPGGPAS